MKSAEDIIIQIATISQRLKQMTENCEAMLKVCEATNKFDATDIFRIFEEIEELKVNHSAVDISEIIALQIKYFVHLIERWNTLIIPKTIFSKRDIDFLNFVDACSKFKINHLLPDYLSVPEAYVRNVLPLSPDQDLASIWTLPNAEFIRKKALGFVSIGSIINREDFEKCFYKALLNQLNRPSCSKLNFENVRAVVRYRKLTSPEDEVKLLKAIGHAKAFILSQKILSDLISDQSATTDNSSSANIASLNLAYQRGITETRNLFISSGMALDASDLRPLHTEFFRALTLACHGIRDIYDAFPFALRFVENLEACSTTDAKNALTKWVESIILCYRNNNFQGHTYIDYSLVHNFLVKCMVYAVDSATLFRAVQFAALNILLSHAAPLLAEASNQQQWADGLINANTIYDLKKIMADIIKNNRNNSRKPFFIALYNIKQLLRKADIIPQMLDTIVVMKKLSSDKQEKLLAEKKARVDRKLEIESKLNGKLPTNQQEAANRQSRKKYITAIENEQKTKVSAETEATMQDITHTQYLLDSFASSLPELYNSRDFIKDRHHLSFSEVYEFVIAQANHNELFLNALKLFTLNILMAMPYVIVDDDVKFNTERFNLSPWIQKASMANTFMDFKYLLMEIVRGETNTPFNDSLTNVLALLSKNGSSQTRMLTSLQNKPKPSAVDIENEFVELSPETSCKKPGKVEVNTPTETKEESSVMAVTYNDNSQAERWTFIKL